MDEIDSIGSARMESGTGNGDSEVQRTMLELLNQLRTRNPDEGAISVMSNCTCQQSLSCAWRSIKEDTLENK